MEVIYTIFIPAFFPSIYPSEISWKGGTEMKKYVAPEMKALAFTAEEAIAAVSVTGSNIHNDVELQW